MFLQVTAASATDLAIPDRPFTFGELISAQAAGDAQVLSEHGRPVLRLHLTDRAAGVRTAAGPRLVACRPGSILHRKLRHPRNHARNLQRRQDVSAAGRRNPLRDPRDRRLNRIAGPSSLVLFGVTGDLARKKLMPAVYDLANRGLLPPSFALVGFARREWDNEDFAAEVKDVGQGLRPDPV